MPAILPLLGLLFIALKLMGYIAWSWLWVLAPFWVGILIALIVFGIWGVMVGLLKAKLDRAYRRR